MIMITGTKILLSHILLNFSINPAPIHPPIIFMTSNGSPNLYSIKPWYTKIIVVMMEIGKVTAFWFTTASLKLSP